MSNIPNEEKTKEELKVLLHCKFFDLESGQIIIDKHNGYIQEIKYYQVLYKRKKLDKKN